MAVINQANLRLGTDSERRNSKKFIDIFLKMALCDDLPIEIMSKILALVAAKKERTDWSRNYWTDDSDANTTYLLAKDGEVHFGLQKMERPSVAKSPS